MPIAETLFTLNTTLSPEALQADALIVAVFQQKEAAEKGFEANCDTLTNLDNGLKGQLLAQAKEEKFDGSKGKVLSVRSHGAFAFKRVVLVGLGEKTKYSPIKLEKAFQAATAHLLALSDIKHLGAWFPQSVSDDVAQSTYAMTDGILQATYYSLEAKKPGPQLAQVTVVLPQNLKPAVEAALPVAQAMAKARSYAKDYVNMPSNLKTVQTMVTAATALQNLPHVSVSIQSDVAWIKEHMPSFYCVAQGSLASDPPNATKKLAYVGKTVIFDTGGYQVKTGNYMVTMKGDMTGGAMVLGAVKALAELGAGVAVTAYLAATPNKIDSDAFIPDSIVGSSCGKKIEIRHTDG